MNDVESPACRNGWLIAAGVNGMIAVAAGAFAAHGLKERLDAGLLAIFQTGAQYHLYHTLALLGVAMLRSRGGGSGFVRAAGWAFLLGILLFSGSLYALALSGVRALGAITPFGGVAFLIGWLLLAVQGSRGTSREA